MNYQVISSFLSYLLLWLKDSRSQDVPFHTTSRWLHQHVARLTGGSAFFFLLFWRNVIIPPDSMRTFCKDQPNQERAKSVLFCQIIVWKCLLENDTHPIPNSREFVPPLRDVVTDQLLSLWKCANNVTTLAPLGIRWHYFIDFLVDLIFKDGGWALSWFHTKPQLSVPARLAHYYNSLLGFLKFNLVPVGV